MINRREIKNLREIEPKSGQTFANLLMDEIPEYKYPVITFQVSEKYSPDYVLTNSTIEEEVVKNYKDEGIIMNATVISATYFSDSIKKDLNLTIYMFHTVEDAQKEWISSLATYSAPVLPPSEADGIVVGDLAVGVSHNINFVRGNMQVRLRAVSGNSVVEVSKEIDEQIVNALNNGGRQ